MVSWRRLGIYAVFGTLFVITCLSCLYVFFWTLDITFMTGGDIFEASFGPPRALHLFRGAVVGMLSFPILSQILLRTFIRYGTPDMHFHMFRVPLMLANTLWSMFVILAAYSLA